MDGVSRSRASPCAALCGALALQFAPQATSAADLLISILDRNGHPVPDVVVTVDEATGSPAKLPHERPAAVMDQKNRAFIPGVLVVATGTEVAFPNNDSVSHQVYSFSQARSFQLPLYKGATRPPVKFDKPGLVVVGCNIHDEMVGYIYVTDAPAFGQTDAQGHLRLEKLAEGTHQVRFWNPWLAESDASLRRSVALSSGGATELSLQLTRPLRSQPSPGPGKSGWEY
jgi:plastocyanin